VTILADTSALLPVLAGNDVDHERCRRTFEDLARANDLIAHSYVIVEAASLAQRRLGTDAVRTLLAEIVPLIEIVFVDRELHDAAVTAHLAASRRAVSLVDWTSFELMRRRGIGIAFALDTDFKQQGFRTVP